MKKDPDGGRKPMAVYVGVLFNAATAAAEILAATFTGSSAMLAEGIHSGIDAANECLLLLGEKLSKRPPDENHPFGYSPELYFWSFIVAIVLFGIGGGISVYEGIHRLQDSTPIENPLVNYVVLAVSALFAGGSLLVAVKELRAKEGKHHMFAVLDRSKDPADYAIFYEELAAFVGTLTAFAGVVLSVWTRNMIWDALASIVVSFILAAMALLMAYKTRALLLGQGMESDELQDIYALVKADPAVEQMRQPLSMHLGPEDVLLTLDIQFRQGLATHEIVSAVDRLESEIRKRHPEIKRIYIEADAIVGVRAPHPDGHGEAKEKERV